MPDAPVVPQADSAAHPQADSAAQPQADNAAPQATADQNQPQPQVTASTEGTDVGAPAAQGSTADLENRVSQNMASKAANDADSRPRTGLFARILYGAMSHLEGAGKGLATGGIPGAVEGAISPKIADTHFQQQEQMRQNVVNKQQADIANAIADAHLREQQAANYPAELQERRNENDSKTVMGLKAYSVNPLGAVHDADSAGAMAQQLLTQGKMPWVLNPSKGTFLVYDMGQVSGTPMGLQDYNLAAVFNGMPTYEPDQWMNPKMGQIRTAGLKFAQGFLHPDVKNLMQADQMIAKYQGIVKGIDDGHYSNIPADAKQRVITTLGEMVEAHNNYLSEMMKMRTAPTNARFYKVDYADGTVDFLTGPQAHSAANGGAPNGKTPVNAQVHSMLQVTDANGRQVAVTPTEAASYGIDPSTGTKMAANEAFAVHAARQLIQPDGLFNKIAAEVKGLGPNKLNLGNSRISDFLASKVGTGADYVPLRNDVQLLITRLQQVHVGNRPSDKLYDHFSELVQTGKMDFPTLMSALAEVHDYAVDRAMLPSRQKR